LVNVPALVVQLVGVTLIAVAFALITPWLSLLWLGIVAIAAGLLIERVTPLPKEEDARTTTSS
jgi:hypothetical protein